MIKETKKKIRCKVERVAGQLYLRKSQIVLLIIVVMFITGYAVIAIDGKQPPTIQPPASEGNGGLINDQADFSQLNEIYKIIRGHYVGAGDKDEIVDGAIRGMLDALGDRHSYYMDPEETAEFEKSLDESFDGIGAEVTLENGKVTVVTPIKGSPSEKAGLLARDQILSVNDESLEDMTLYEAVNKIKGPKGTEARLEVYRPAIDDVITISIVRDKIPNITIYSEAIKSDKGLIGYIEITNFGEKTYNDFRKALNNLEKQGMKGLIIDVRGNPGGYLQSVLDIGNLTVPDHQVIVRVADKLTEDVFRSKMDSAKYPITLLINESSASASEILASALQESGGYPLVGATTFGKGTVQNLYSLDGGGTVKLTTAKWLTPSGKEINGVGVEPDYFVENPRYFESTIIPNDASLGYDDNGPLVANIQLILNGLYGANESLLREDGYFDRKTEELLKIFQSDEGLSQTGVVDKRTSERLQTRIIAEIKNPKNDLQLQKAIEVLEGLIK